NAAERVANASRATFAGQADATGAGTWAACSGAPELPRDPGDDRHDQQYDDDADDDACLEDVAYQLAAGTHERDGEHDREPACDSDVHQIPPASPHTKRHSPSWSSGRAAPTLTLPPKKRMRRSSAARAPFDVCQPKRCMMSNVSVRASVQPT